MTRRENPPKRYRVYDMGSHRVHLQRNYWLSRALLVSDGEHWTEDDAVAACWEHHDRIAAEALREAARDLREWLGRSWLGGERNDGALLIIEDLERRARELDPEGGENARERPRIDPMSTDEAIDLLRELLREDIFGAAHARTDEVCGATEAAKVWVLERRAARLAGMVKVRGEWELDPEGEP